MFIASESDLDEADVLTLEDWVQLEALYQGLKPFWEMTLLTEGQGVAGAHGVIWETLPTLNILLLHVEREQARLQETPQPAQPARTGGRRPPASQNQPRINPLLVCYQNAWEVLLEYNNLTDEAFEIYAAATLLNPCLRKHYFELAWTGNAARSIEPMMTRNRQVWETKYREVLPTREPPSRSTMSRFITELQATQPANVGAADDFSRYMAEPMIPETSWHKENIFLWWSQSSYPGLKQWAFDVLSIPATSAELERIFSLAKRIWTDDRNRLAPDAFEAILSLLHWELQKLYTIPS
jgi:hypothetical protein